VRADVAAVLFDEPLTVIDPHLKWQLRRKLKQIHHELKLTLIYVTHDQVEALTFADQVVVMSRGRVMQVGAPDALFERPRHTFVGHFIGSPGMNFLPVQCRGAHWEAPHAGGACAAGAAGRRRAAAGHAPGVPAPGPPDAPARCRHGAAVQDIGTYLMLTAGIDGHTLKARCRRHAAAGRGAGVWLQLLGRTPATTATRSCWHERINKPVNQRAWFLILPVILCVAFSAILPLMTVVNYSVQDIIGPSAACSWARSGLPP
jgi:glycerol transport system ATP-binding protein